MARKILIFLPIIFTLFSLNQPVWAAVRCEKQYAGEVCIRTGELQINKVVWDPQNQRFVDNLDVTDHKFSPGEEVVFQLRIKNVGDAALERVEVKDTLPFFLFLTSGSLSFEVTDLTPGETEEREIKARVVSAESLPNNQSIFCDVNVAEARAGELRDRDTAKVCVTKKVLAVKVLPPTGFQNLSLFLVLAIVTGAAGIALLVLGRH